MDSPSSSSTTGSGDANKQIAIRSSFVESIRGCGARNIDKEELRQNLTMPQYLRFAMRDSIRFQDPTATAQTRSADDVAPSTPMVVFINPRSGGRNGPVLKERLQHLMSEEQVIIAYISLSLIN